LSDNKWGGKAFGEFVLGWSDITTMDLKGIEPYVSSGFRYSFMKPRRQTLVNALF
jgi:hypothetical protein